MTTQNLIKDTTILQVIDHLEVKFGENSFRLKDYWEGDLFAIGIADFSDEYLLYISTYKQQSMHYYASVETEDLDGYKPGTLIKEYENATLQELENIFLFYFKLTG